MKKKILLSLLVLVTVVTLTGCGSKKKKSDKKVDGRNVVNYNTAFFIKDGSKYALFNEDGKRLTDFEFTSAGSFVNGAAIVKNEIGSGVINENGKMVIDFGKYKYIYQEAGLYKVTDGEHNEFLLNSKGKIITALKDKTITTYIGQSKYSILLDKESNEYQVLNSNGDTLVKFKKGSEDKPSTNTEKNFLSVYGGGKNYIIDLISEKMVLEFEADSHYCVNNASDDGKIITLNSCVGSFQRQEKTTYKFIKDGKLYDLSDKCDSVGYINNNLTCTKDNKKYLLDSNLNTGIAIEGVSYADSEHYAKAKSGSFNGVDFYEKDNVVKNVECRVMHDYGYSKSGLYILSTYFSTKCNTQSGTYEYYNTKGENVFNKSFASAQKFDDNNLARVSEDRKNYYLIDAKGNKVTDEYDNIFARYDFYSVTKNKLVGLLDNTGKLIIEPKYKSIDIYKEQGVKYLKLTTEDGKYIIYNGDTKKEIMTFDSNPSLSTNYMYVTKEGKKLYYTYSGKLFYTAE